MTIRTAVVVCATLASACQQASPLAPSGAAPTPAASATESRGVQASVTGDGVYDAGTAVEFSMNALQNADGSAKGAFRHRATLASGLVDITGRVTCLAIDAATGRAWIGGVVTANQSASPAFTTAIHQVGRDVWFRVLDSGEGQGAVDRSTFLGFEGGGGIITSTQYCSVRIWPNDPPNARTSPLVSGNVQVRP